MWTIIVERVSGIYLELLFFDGVLNYGQGFLVCMIFGFDNKLIVLPLMKKYLFKFLNFVKRQLNVFVYPLGGVNSGMELNL